jgi:hypothetical protein
MHLPHRMSHLERKSVVQNVKLIWAIVVKKAVSSFVFLLHSHDFQYGFPCSVVWLWERFHNISVPPLCQWTSSQNIE